MKIRKRTEVKEVTIKEYVAEDGTVFTSEQDCREYEETMTDSAMVHIIRIRDEQDAETITKWAGRYSGNTRKLTADDIGRTVMLVYEEYYNYANSSYWDVLFYEEDILEQAQEFWQNVNKAEIA